MHFSDPKPLTAKYVHQVWQKEWEETVLLPNKFHEFLPKLLRPPVVTCNTKNKNTVLNRLKIGYVLVIRIRHIRLFKVKKKFVFVLHVLLESRLIYLD